MAREGLASEAGFGEVGFEVASCEDLGGSLRGASSGFLSSCFGDDAVSSFMGSFAAAFSPSTDGGGRAAGP